MIKSWRIKGDQAVFRERLSELVLTYPELTFQRSPEEASESICASTEDLEAWVEVVVRDDSGRLVAFAIATDDDDPHVGPLMSVQWRIVFPEAPAGTTARIQKELVEIARACNYRVMAYTKRTGLGKFEITYKQLKEKTHG